MTSIIFILFLVMCGSGGGKASPAKPKSDEDVWPSFGINLCQAIVHLPTRVHCIECFVSSDSDWVQASGCVAEWLPPRFAQCVTTSDSSQTLFVACLQRAKRMQNNEIKRAKVLYNKGGKYMKVVGDAKVIPDGGAAMYSCMAQELLVNTDSLQEELDKSSDECFSRFQMDPVNEQWHIHKNDRSKAIKPQVVHKAANNNKSNSRMDHLNERTHLVYEYGYVGHDMPFHGIGPFAVDILKGECIVKTMENYGNLDMLVESAITNDSPVPAWIFREMLNRITDITLPQ